MSSPAVAVLPRKRRGVELFLILFALALTLGAYVQVDLNVTGQISETFPTLAGICVLLAALAHIAVRWRLPYADPVILPCVILLNGLGLAMIHRIDLINDPPTNGARQQLIWTGARRAVVHPGRGAAARPPAAAPLHVHPRAGRYGVAAAAAGARAGHREVRRPDLDRGRSVQLPARRGGQGAAVDRLRRLPGREARRACPGRLPHPRDRPAAGPRPRPDRGDLGGSAWPSWSSSATWAPRCCSSGCS